MTVDYSKWALPCLMRELEKVVPELPSSLPLTFHGLRVEKGGPFLLKDRAQRVVNSLHNNPQWGSWGKVLPFIHELKRRFDLP